MKRKLPLFSGLVKMSRMLLLLLLQCPATLLWSQQHGLDTLVIDKQAAEKIFLQENLPLLAERLHIDQADARILQAKAWPNPVFELNDVQLYNKPSTDPSPGILGTDFWRNRTFGGQLEQMVQLAGKRKKNIAFETRSKELAESSFTDFLLSLKAEFRQRLSELSYLQQVAKDMHYQQEVISDLLRAQDAQYKTGNISQSQLFRLKALQISFQSELNDFNEQISNLQLQLKNLMALPPQTYLELSGNRLPYNAEYLKSKPLDELLQLAEQHSPALKSAENATQVKEAYLKVEKANAIPNINFLLSYDRNGNNQLDFAGAGFSMELPFFNRNRGNIKVASFEWEKAKLLQKSKTNEINNAVIKTWQDLSKAISLYESIDADYLDKLDDMIKALSENFAHRNISLLEFLDMFESFKDSKAKYYSTLYNIDLKKEELNYLTGTEL